MKNLGKTVFFLMFLLFSTSLWGGSVVANVDHKKVLPGERVTLQIEVFGDEIEVPQIDTLCGVDVVSSSTRQSIQIINTNVTKNYVYAYGFEPENNCTIEPIEVKVDGKTEKTKPIKITVTNRLPQNKNENFILELKSDKKEVFVGEPFEVRLIFKQKRGVEAIDSKFYPPKLEGFWIKHQSEPKKEIQGEYIITTIYYTMAAQREGNLHISPAKIKIAVRDKSVDFWNSFMPSVQWRTYYSNPIDLKVYAPPKGVKLVGNFDISIKVDKTMIHPGEAVNGLITIQGNGNVEDIEAFKPYIKNGNVFEEKPIIDEKNGIFKQKIAFVADNSFTIPPFSIHFFDPKTKRITTKSTAPIKIKVIGAKKEEPLTIKKATQTNNAAQSIQKSSFTSMIKSSFAITWIILSFIAGVFIGGILVFFKFYASNKKLLKRFNFDDKKTLFIKLLPYKDRHDVKEVLDMLEDHLYGDKNVKIDKEKLKAVIQKYTIR